MGNTGAKLRLTAVEQNNDEYWKSSYGLLVEWSCGSYPPDGFSAVTHVILYDVNDFELYKTIVPVPKSKGSGIVSIPDFYFEPGKKYQLAWKAEINASSAIATSSVFTCVDNDYFMRLARAVQEEYAQALREAGSSKYYMSLTPGERKVLKKYFNEIDKNQNGKIEITELRKFYMTKFGVDLSDNDLISMVREADKNKNSLIELPEFVDICVDSKQNKTSFKWENIERVFDAELERARLLDSPKKRARN